MVTFRVTVGRLHSVGLKSLMRTLAYTQDNCYIDEWIFMSHKNGIALEI